MIINSYSKEQVNLLKGIGILLIVLHNYYHTMPPALGESEFRFYPGQLSRYLDYLGANWGSLINLLFSYLGHYGVQIFVFFSVYGLAKKYRDTDEIPYVQFLRDRLSKIYITFVLAIVVYVALGWAKALVSGVEYVQWWDSLLYKLLLISNFIPGQALKPVGPWWFLPFIFTLYIAFPFLMQGYRKIGNPFLWALAALGLVLELLLWSALESHELSINHLVFGYLPLISLAMYMSGTESVEFKAWQILLVVALFIAGNLNGIAWMLSGLTFVLITLFMFEISFERWSDKNLFMRFVAYCGVISFPLFLVNGFLRYPFQTIAMKFDSWYITDVLALVSLVVSIVGSLGLMYIDKAVRHYV